MNFAEVFWALTEKHGYGLQINIDKISLKNKAELQSPALLSGASSGDKFRHIECIHDRVADFFPC